MMHSSQAFTENGVMLRAFTCSGGAVSLFYTPKRGKIAGFTKRAPNVGDMLDIHAEPMRSGGDLPRVYTDIRKACGAVISASGSLLRIRALQAALEIIYMTQADGDPSPALYRVLERFLHGLSASDDGIYALPVFEAMLLDASGYRLSPDRCAKFPDDETACYISPKTGAGVGFTAGEPYKERLLPLPASFRHALLHAMNNDGCEDEPLPSVQQGTDFTQACIVTEHFLIREFDRRQFPAREALLAAVKRRQLKKKAV